MRRVRCERCTRAWDGRVEITGGRPGMCACCRPDAPPRGHRARGCGGISARKGWERGGDGWRRKLSSSPRLPGRGRSPGLITCFWCSQQAAWRAAAGRTARHAMHRGAASWCAIRPASHPAEGWDQRLSTGAAARPGGLGSRAAPSAPPCAPAAARAAERPSLPWCLRAGGSAHGGVLPGHQAAGAVPVEEQGGGDAGGPGGRNRAGRGAPLAARAGGDGTVRPARTAHPPCSCRYREGPFTQD